jgi:hypothetical protein
MLALGLLPVDTLHEYLPVGHLGFPACVACLHASKLHACIEAEMFTKLAYQEAYPLVRAPFILLGY